MSLRQGLCASLSTDDFDIDAVNFTPFCIGLQHRTRISNRCQDCIGQPFSVRGANAKRGQKYARRAYNCATLLVERKELMQGWADMLDDFRKGKAEISLVPRRDAEIAPQADETGTA